MKNLIATIGGAVIMYSVVLLLTISAAAQTKPLTGSGNTVTKTFGYKNFDKLDLQDLDGLITVEIGKPFSISVQIDDNLEKLLSVNEDKGKLKIKLNGNLNNKLYVEETNISITVTMPEASVICHRSNSKLLVNGIAGRYFKIKNIGNGGAVLKGSTDELDIICRDNGTVRAEEVTAKLVKVNKSGNGNVYIKTDNAFTANGSGNGDVINTGKGLANGNSTISGNGKIRYKNNQ